MFNKNGPGSLLTFMDFSWQSQNVGNITLKQMVTKWRIATNTEQFSHKLINRLDKGEYMTDS